MTQTKFHFETCAYCGREIVEDARSRTGWRHVTGGVKCPETFAVPEVKR